MTIHKIIALFLAMHSCMSSAAVFSFPEQHGILVKLVSPDKRTPLFYTKGLNVTQDFKDGYMVTAQYFNERGFYPVGIIVHNKSDEVVTISAASIGSQQRSVNDIIEHCSKFEGNLAVPTFVGVVGIWAGIFQADNGRRMSGELFLLLLAASGLCIAGGFAVDLLWYSLHYQTKKRLLAGCILNEEITIKPGQKIIKYVLLDRYKDGFDRTVAGVLNGLEFTIFNSDNTPRFNCTAQVST